MVANIATAKKKYCGSRIGQLQSNELNRNHIKRNRMQSIVRRPSRTEECSFI